MTWDDVLALNDEALNLAIETHCLGHQWQSEYYYDQGGRPMWVLRHPGIGTVHSSVPHLYTTESWKECMALMWRYHLSLRAHSLLIMWTVELGEDRHGIVVMTEAEARRAICQLALWQALQEGEDVAPG